MKKKIVAVAIAAMCAFCLGLMACSGSTSSAASSSSSDAESASPSDAESASPSDAESASPSDAAPASPSDAAPASPSDAESDSAKSESTASANNHTDDFTIVNVVRGEDDGYGYWDLEVTVQNNTDEEKNFLGFQIDELDANGNILNSYMSYNKNACETIVEPGQQFTIALTEETDDGIAGMQSRYCEWGDFSGEVVECEYSEKFKVMF